MRRIVVFFSLLALCLFPTPAQARVMIEEKGTIDIPTGSTIDDDLFIGAENFNLQGNVNGSVYVGAGNVDVWGNIKGDLVLGAGKAVVTGTVGGDIYVGSGDLTLTKVKVGGSVIAGAGNITIDEDSQIAGSLIAGSGNLRNSAPVGRNVMVAGGNIFLDSQVGKEIRVAGGQIELGPHVAVLGNVTYTIGDDDGIYRQDPAATVAGTVTQYNPPIQAKEDLRRARAEAGKLGVVAHRGWLLVSFLGSLLLGFLLLKLFPKTSLGLSSQVQSHLIPSLGIGFLLVVAFIPVLLVLILTIIGLPLAGLLLLVFCLSLHLAKLASAYALGKFITKQFNWSGWGTYAVFATGLIVFFFLRAIPVIGWFATILFTWTGLGAIWLYTRAHLKNL